MTRAEAARINGARSKGPKTEAGKAISSQNALHFGLNACQVVLPGEDPAEYEELFNGINDTYLPQTSLELDLVSEMAAARWRLRRIPRMEKAATEALIERLQNEPNSADLTDEQFDTKVWNQLAGSPEMKQVHRHETRLRRVWEKARIELEALIYARVTAEREAEREAAREAMIANSKASLDAAIAARRQQQKPQPQPVQNEPRPVTRPETTQQPDTRAA